ncbi:hypothetical protein PSE10A_46740 [Pseudomonas amygdali pv. eriobotryae]|uniref:Uncharacterized protein n=1 Tax=Pseudomonas amygdali pv. eriobotryae TaxID=129137 RepID=A0A9P3AIE4_PSEA0|nr:hypothetical protein [Pseudomonas amygdali]GFZ62163.1 hypothetical protein PSE10A_46740 [Pseudomonas amygdali pv. eriobotryae]
MSNKNITSAEFFLNQFNDYANELSFNGETLHAVTDKSLIMKKSDGKLINFSKSDLEQDITFQMEMGIFDEEEITKENAQRKFVQIRSLLPA